jgi:beta-glucosidase
MHDELNKKLFGDNFAFGVSLSALQTEGAFDEDGKGLSIWDTFQKIKNKDNPKIACDFYNRYKEDIAIAASLNITNFRFSLSWSRILPSGTGTVNQTGLDFYHRVIDACRENNIEPWITLYHWDLPQVLEDKGGWTNRAMIDWFSEYVSVCVRAFKDKVKYWMVLNEPMAFTGAGYFLGDHAPGKKGLKNFLQAVHHTAMCQGAGYRMIKKEYQEAEVGSTFSCSYFTPYSTSARDIQAVNRIDALLNRLFVETSLGLGYPFDDLPILKKIEKYFHAGDLELMKADFDFIGIQNYTREAVKHTFYHPRLKATLVPADKRKVYHTSMNWEVYPESIYEMIKKFSAYRGVKKIIVTENGAAFPDKVENGKINDEERIHYLSQYIQQVLRAKQEGYPVNGYFVWSLTDNFEWAEGYHPRFGLVYIDFKNQQRIIKESGYWYKKLLE